jgi:hypothetical protein
MQQEFFALKDELDAATAENAELKLKLSASLAKEQGASKELVRVADACDAAKEELAAALRKTQTLDAERRQLFLKTQEMENLCCSRRLSNLHIVVRA